MTAWSPTYGHRSRTAPSSSTVGSEIAHGRPSASVVSGPGATMSVAVFTDLAQIEPSSGSLEANEPVTDDAGAPPAAASTAVSATTGMQARSDLTRARSRAGTRPWSPRPASRRSRARASSGSSFQTERNTSGATLTAVPRPHSTTSSPSLNCSFPEMTK